MPAIFRSLSLELDDAVLFREQRVITPNSDVHPGMKVRATLAHDDVSGNSLLPAV
jgi:hypothetical protein